jgi:6,7-dimethyl-8-ribityllumazine synthase
MNVATPDLKGNGLRIGIVWSRFNEELVRVLLTACDKQLVELGVAAADIDVVSVPGALEIPLALQTLALERRGFGGMHRYDALVALGCVVRGDTYHFEIVANESARGILDVQLETGLPIANGVLTTDTDEQAQLRAPVKGAEAARVAIEMANTLRMVAG